MDISAWSRWTFWEIILIIVFIGCLVYWYGTRNLNYFKKRKVKYVRPSPYFGNLGSTFFKGEHFFKIMDRIYNAFPDQRYIGFFEFQTPSVWLKDPELIKNITVKHFEHFVDHKNMLSEHTDSLFTNSLFALQGQKWRDMRSTLSPTFTGSKMRLMYPLIVECAQQLNDHVSEQINMGGNNFEIEIKDLFTRYTNDVIATSAFGMKVDSLKYKTNEFYLMGKKITDVNFFFVLKYLAFSSFPKIMRFFGLSLMQSDVAQFFRSLVKNTMSDREMRGMSRPDMIQLLMEAKKVQLKDNISSNNISTRIWSDDELASQAFVFFLAGFETSSTLLSYAAYEIATRPKIQKKLQEEIDQVLRINQNLSYDTIMQMKYLDMFILETLRFWPPVGGIDRVCVKSYTLPPPNRSSHTEFNINVGDSIFIPIRAIHRDPLYFHDPMQFIPERFSDENKHQINQFAYMPFGSGPRQCIGSRFAMMEIKVVIVCMLSKFSFIPCSKTENPAISKMKFTGTLPDNGIWIRLTNRYE